MLLFLFLVLFFFYFFSFCSMSLDVIPQECPLGGGGYGYLPPETQRVCVYSCPMEGKCPCAPPTSEPSPEVLEENQHQKDIQNISRSTQKLVYELQHAKMKLAVLKLTQEIDQLSSTTPYPTGSSTVALVEEPEPAVSEKKEKGCKSCKYCNNISCEITCEI